MATIIPNPIPKGTTREQWERYEKELKDFRERCELTRPRRINFELVGDYDRACSKWEMHCSCDAPNAPGTTEPTTTEGRGREKGMTNQE